MPIVKTQFPPSVSLTNLNGVNGFVITGFPGSCSSVSEAGDLNDDGIADLIIGSSYGRIFSYCSSGAGVGYVLFGKSGVGGSGRVSVSSLTGHNGFTIVGIPWWGDGLDFGWSISGVGDVNGDGIADLIIGAPYASIAFTRDGACYVLFGQSEIGSSGSVSVSSLTGSNGFIITGFPANSGGGYAVSGAGDVNGDGLADLIIGAPDAFNFAGSSYVIFGKPGLGSSGSVDVSKLTGSNGFIITGFPANSGGGYAVSGAGDVNGDGLADLIIGAPDAYNFAGSSYVIFGKPGLGSSGRVDISNLTGSNGFVITGFRINSMGGYSIGEAGDVNDDGIADLIIGAPSASSDAGESYVLFGQSGIGSSGSVNVSSLAGHNGFVITGFWKGSQGGHSVGKAGDVNDDGIMDLLIGAPYVSNGGYVLFGQSGIGSSGRVSISSLTGSNGFGILFPMGSGGGSSFSVAGDVNGDGIVDLIMGAPGVSGYASANYVLFGESTSPVLSTNQLTIKEDQTLTLSSQYLNATDPINPSRESTLLFTISSIQHGRFYSSNNTRLSLSSFTLQQVQNRQICFAQDGSGWAPSYAVSVGYPGLFAVTPAQASAITFQQYFRLVNNELIINQGQTVVVTTDMLSARDFYNSANDPNLVLSVSNVQHGYFALTSSPGVVITSFTQIQIQHGDIQFSHDGSANSPSYSVVVINGATRTTPEAGIISFDIPPVLIKNSLTVNQGQSAVLSNDNLSALDPFATEAELVFTVSKEQHGYFAFIGAPTTSIINFNQAQVNSGEVQFVPDGTNKAPSYFVLVTRRMSAVLGPQPAVITFNDIPVIVTNQLKVTQGETVILGTGDLSATDQETSAGELVFTAGDLKNGHFEDITTPGIATTIFAQQRVVSGAMKFVTDGSANAPAYTITVSDGILSSPASKAIVNFKPKQPDISTQSDPVTNAIIGGVVSGIVGLGFFALKAFLERKAAKSLKQVLEGGQTDMERRLITFQKEVIRPVANKVFSYIKTTNLIGYRSERDTRAYVAAIETLLGKLIDLGVNLDLQSMQAAQQSRLFTEIAKQTRLQLVPNYGCCSCSYVASFFKPEITPQQVEDNAEVIAAAVQAAMRSSQTQNSKQMQKPTAEAAEMNEITSCKIP